MTHSKGLVPNTISGIVRAFLVAGVVIGAMTVGFFGDTLDETNNALLSQFRSMSGEIVVDDKDTLSAATEYNVDRATGCDVVDEKSNDNEYDDLDSTAYTADPPCVGISQSGTPEGTLGTVNDFEGRRNRIPFTVKPENGNSITLGPDSTYIENNLMAVTKNGFHDYSISNCRGEVDGRVVDGVGRWTDSNENPKYITFFETEAPEDGTGPWLTETGDLTKQNALCEDAEEGVHQMSVAAWELRDQDVELTLCNGAKGYIQVNKHGGQGGFDPFFDGEAGDDWVERGPFYAPHIVITETGEC